MDRRPVLKSVAFKSSASLDLEKGISKDTHEHRLPMARWWVAPVRERASGSSLKGLYVQPTDITALWP